MTTVRRSEIRSGSEGRMWASKLWKRGKGGGVGVREGRGGGENALRVVIMNSLDALRPVSPDAPCLRGSVIKPQLRSMLIRTCLGIEVSNFTNFLHHATLHNKDGMGAHTTAAGATRANRRAAPTENACAPGLAFLAARHKLQRKPAAVFEVAARRTRTA